MEQETMLKLNTMLGRRVPYKQGTFFIKLSITS